MCALLLLHQGNSSTYAVRRHGAFPLLSCYSSLVSLRVDSGNPGLSDALPGGDAGRKRLRSGAGARAVHSRGSSRSSFARCRWFWLFASLWLYASRRLHAGSEASGLLAQIWRRPEFLLSVAVLPWPEPDATEKGASGSSVNKVVFGAPGLGRGFRAGRRGGGARRLRAGSGASCRFPFAGFMESSDVGLCRPFSIDNLLRSGRAPRRCSFFDAKVSPRAASGTCGDFNGTLVPNRLVQVTQRPTYFSSFSSGPPAVRQRGHARRRISFRRISQGCVHEFCSFQGCFCKRGTAVHCVDVSSVSPMYSLFY